MIEDLQTDREEISKKIEEIEIEVAMKKNDGMYKTAKSLRLPKFKSSARSKSVLNEDFNFVNKSRKMKN